MTIELYELAGRDDRRFSPYCWRTRMALEHKGLKYKTIPIRFCDKRLIAFSKQDRVPVIRDGSNTVWDSWKIAEYLETTYRDCPSLFGGKPAQSLAQFLNVWVDRTLHGTLMRLIVADILDHVDLADRDYFIQSRTARFGKTPAQIQTRSSEDLMAFDLAISNLRDALDDRAFMSGPVPGYGDYIVFGAFAWARGVSDFSLLERDDPIYSWRDRMFNLFDGMPGTAVGYTV